MGRDLFKKILGHNGAISSRIIQPITLDRITVDRNEGAEPDAVDIVGEGDIITRNRKDIVGGGGWQVDTWGLSAT
jgi:hypothetical protein